MGRIGLGIAGRARAFGMQVHYHNRSPHPDAAAYTHYLSLEALMRASDVFCVCAPSMAQTRGSINRERLALLPAGAVFVNIVRGDLVDEAALIDAIECGHLSGAGLDVYRNEPRISPRFFGLPRTTLLPHIGSATHDARVAMGRIALDALHQWIEGTGKPANCLNPSVLEHRSPKVKP